MLPPFPPQIIRFRRVKRFFAYVVWLLVGTVVAALLASALPDNRLSLIPVFAALLGAWPLFWFLWVKGVWTIILIIISLITLEGGVLPEGPSEDVTKMRSPRNIFFSRSDKQKMRSNKDYFGDVFGRNVAGVTQEYDWLRQPDAGAQSARPPRRAATRADRRRADPQ